ncbi:protein transporter SEC24 [Mycena alexandri]|uniref:Protein transporter SEC24 n=1 Tax=Mycena alexandri TaxID=1745969 RepID=A0AAD6SVD4_9AGAR|nr:protein transporter SEC24 [Mycena alexandri]
MSSPTHAPKRRQYAAGQTQVYYGSPEGQGQHPVDRHRLYEQTDTGTLLEHHHVDIMTYPPDPRHLSDPPSEIRLPPNLPILSDAHPASLYHSCTLNAVPQSESLLDSSKIPLGLVISPYRTLADGEEPVPIIEDGVISRCRMCKAYLNPYVRFVDGGSRWRCSLCAHAENEVPPSFYSNTQAGDRYSQVELSHNVYDLVATPEYVRSVPQSPAYVFLLDVGQEAIRSGMFLAAIRTISENLDNLPNNGLRTKVAIVCYDTALYFFSLPVSSLGPRHLRCSDLEEPYLPRCDDLLVNLSEARQALDVLLERLPAMFMDHRASGSATGPALDGALLLMSPTGGKIVLLSASVPTVGKGALNVTEDQRSEHDTQKEPALDKSASAFYHAFAISCVEACVSVDMFLAGDRYRGVVTLTLLPHYTSGQTFYYPAFNAAEPEDAVKFATELGRVLAMPSMLEAEMRVRCSRGISVKAMYGDFFVQASHRVVMPAVPMDQSYVFEFQIDETLPEPIVVFQTGLLHTKSSGERRIRVLTLALPTTSVIADVFASADVLAITTLLAKRAVQRPSVLTLEDRRDKLFKFVADLCAAYTVANNQSNSPELQLLLPANLKMLPILVLGLFKKVRESAQLTRNARIAVRLATDRAYTRVVLSSAAMPQLIQYIYPRLYSLHNMPEDVGFIGSEGALIMPTSLPLTSAWWESHGLYLIDDGQVIYLVVARDAVPLLIHDVFGVEDYKALQAGKIDLPDVDSAISQRIRLIIGKIRERRGVVHYLTVCVVKDDAVSGNTAMRSTAVQALVHDRLDDLRLGYRQFLAKVYGKVC